MALAKDPEAWANELSQPPPAGQPYGVPLPGTEKPNRTAIYRHYKFRDQPLLTTLNPELHTLHDFFENSARKYPKKRCFGSRLWNPVTKQHDDKFTWISYAEAAERRKNFGAGIVELHKRINFPKDKYGVGLWAQNRTEWQLTDLALASQSLYTVSLYETLGPETTEYIINHAELSAVATSLNHIPTLIKLAPRLPTLKIIISLDPLDNGELAGNTKADLLKDMAKGTNLQIISMDDVEKLGLESGRPMRPAKANDLCTINYTSGTTGPPKGVALLHSNAVSAICAGRLNGAMRHDDVHISYLPLAHIYGRMVDGIAIYVGGSIGFFRGDITGLVDDMKILKPSGFISVPRLYNRFNSAIKVATVEADGVRGALSRRVVDGKKAAMKLPVGQASNRHFLYDRIWTPKVRAAVGLNRTHTMVSGSAQLDPDVQEFLRAAFGNRFIQGWGMTETYAVGSVQQSDDFTTGNVGAPMASVELCLESAPELEYLVTNKPNPRGELLIRGPCIFSGYYKNDEETKKTIDADGWFHTGDICEFDSMGRVRIIDRKKNVLKLSQGEYISPERIENVFLGSTPLLATAFVHGDAKESNLVAIFGVDPESFPAFATKVLGEKVTAADITALRRAANQPKVRAALLKKLDEIAKSHKFNNFERVRNVYLDVEPFTVENGLLTPTLKTKRPQCIKAFRKQIDDMYSELKAQEGGKARL